LFDTSNLLKINDIHNFLYVKCLKFNSANGYYIYLLLYIFIAREARETKNDKMTK
jgi:hypothetical protein